MPQRLGECHDGVVLKHDALASAQLSVLQYRCHREAAVHVHAYDPHPAPPCNQNAGAGGQHDNYGSALAAHPGKSRGRPDNNSSSQLTVYTASPPCVLPAPPSRSPDISAWLGMPGLHMPDNNTVERAIRPLAMPRSLHPSFSSVWKHYKLALPIAA